MEQAARNALEAAVDELRAMDTGDERPHRVRAARDRLYRRILALLSPRIRQLTRRYALGDMADDAAQACAIGVHRALATYDPARACFSTHVTWTMRGELQSLRHRVRLDQRDSARATGMRTVSFEALQDAGSRDDAPLQIADEGAGYAVESRASDYLAGLWLGRVKEAALLSLRGSPKAATFPQDAAAAVSYWTQGPSGPRPERERQRQNARRVGRYFQAGAARVAAVN